MEAAVVKYVQGVFSPALLLSWARAIVRRPSARDAAAFRRIVSCALQQGALPQCGATITGFLARQVSVLGNVSGVSGNGDAPVDGPFEFEEDAGEQAKAAVLISSLIPFVSATSHEHSPLRPANNLLRLVKQCVATTARGDGNYNTSARTTGGMAARHCGEIVGWACFVLNACKGISLSPHGGNPAPSSSTTAVYDWVANEIGSVFGACVSSRFALRQVVQFVYSCCAEPRKSMFTALAALSSRCFVPSAAAAHGTNLAALVSLTGVAAEENARCVEEHFYAERGSGTASVDGGEADGSDDVDYLHRQKHRFMLEAELSEIQSSIVRQGYISAYLPLLEECAFFALEKPSEILLAGSTTPTLPALVQCEALVALGKLARLCTPLMRPKRQKNLCKLIEANTGDGPHHHTHSDGIRRGKGGRRAGSARTGVQKPTHPGVDVRVSATAVFVWGALMGSLSKETTARIECALCCVMGSVVSCARSAFVRAAAQQGKFFDATSPGPTSLPPSPLPASSSSSSSPIKRRRAKVPVRKKRRTSRPGCAALGFDPLDKCAALRHACLRVFASQVDRKQRLCDEKVMNAVLPALLDPDDRCRTCAESFLRSQQVREGVDVGKFLFLAMARCTVGVSDGDTTDSGVDTVRRARDHQAPDRYARCAMIKKLLQLFKRTKPQRSPELLELLIRELGHRPRLEHAYWIANLQPGAVTASGSIDGRFMACFRQLESVFAQPLLLPKCKACPELGVYLETFLQKAAGKQRGQQCSRTGVETVSLIAERLLQLLKKTQIDATSVDQQTGRGGGHGNQNRRDTGTVRSLPPQAHSPSLRRRVPLEDGSRARALSASINYFTAHNKDPNAKVQRD